MQSVIKSSTSAASAVLRGSALRAAAAAFASPTATSESSNPPRSLLLTRDLSTPGSLSVFTPLVSYPCGTKIPDMKHNGHLVVKDLDSLRTSLANLTSARSELASDSGFPSISGTSREDVADALDTLIAAHTETIKLATRSLAQSRWSAPVSALRDVSLGALPLYEALKLSAAEPTLQDTIAASITALHGAFGTAEERQSIVDILTAHRNQWTEVSESATINAEALQHCTGLEARTMLSESTKVGSAWRDEKIQEAKARAELAGGVVHLISDAIESLGPESEEAA